MKIKKGDNVIILQGKDKGKTGKVLRAIPTEEKVLVEGINILKRHRKGQKEGKGGEIIDVTMPIHVSNVAYIDPKEKKATRIGYKIVKDKKVRVAQKSKTEF